MKIEQRNFEEKLSEKSSIFSRSSLLRLLMAFMDIFSFFPTKFTIIVYQKTVLGSTLPVKEEKFFMDPVSKSKNSAGSIKLILFGRSHHGITTKEESWTFEPKKFNFHKIKRKFSFKNVSQTPTTHRCTNNSHWISKRGGNRKLVSQII